MVVHAVVALCDNRSQGIVPVPARLGNGQDPDNNLYWGAMYGVRAYLTRRAGWKIVQKSSKRSTNVLDRIVLHTTVHRYGRKVDAYLVAEAWDGRKIKAATERFLTLAAGREHEVMDIKSGQGARKLNAGGAAHLVVYVGHNGLMDFSMDRLPADLKNSEARSAIALACKSRSYFAARLKHAGAHSLLLTTGPMAPEAYTLDAVIRSWAAGEQREKIVERAAEAYHKYQKCGMMAARRLFFSEP
jgi:hypothetical protein